MGDRIMEKKIYEKPTIEIVKLQQQYMILAGSNQGVNDELQDDPPVIIGW